MNCERHIWSHGEDRQCAQVVGLTRWYDSSGKAHAACRNHVGVMTSIYPISDAPWPGDLPVEPDPIDQYKSWTDAGWTEAELREAFR